MPDLTDELLDTLCDQSDAQANGMDVRDLERLRDKCLVAVMNGLRSVPYGAGMVVEEFDQQLGALGK